MRSRGTRSILGLGIYQTDLRIETTGRNLARSVPRPQRGLFCELNPLAPERGVFPNPAIPHPAGEEVKDHDPDRLDEEATP